MCFLICGLALALELSREMGALIAGVALSTFPYALDVTAKVTTLRDFFLTLFFVALGMVIPPPDWGLLGGALLYCVFLVASRVLTVFLPLQGMRLGHRVSLLPTLNLCQVNVSVPRLVEARVLCDVLLAARDHTLDAHRAELDRQLGDRHEAIP